MIAMKLGFILLKSSIHIGSIASSFKALNSGLYKISDPVLRVSTSLSDNKVTVRVKDSGCGMKPETKKRIFEPFHTTKPKGTGLGLAITHKILEAHSAQIFVESHEGLGTEFVISFPAKTFENQRPKLENKA